MIANQIETLIHKLINAGKENLFSLNVEIFWPLRSYLSDSAYSNYNKKFYARWLADMYRCEVVSGIVYQFLSDNVLTNNYTTDLSIEIKDYLHVAANEEKKHADILKQKIFEITRELPDFDNSDEQYKNFIINEYKNKTLIEVLIIYFIGETGLLSSFKLLNKHTTDPIWASIFKEFMIDEAQHHTNILKLISKLVQEQPVKNLLEQPFIDEIAHFLYFQNETFKYYILDVGQSLLDTKSNLFYQAYQSEFVKKYQQDFLNKIGKLASILDSTYNEQDYHKTFDKHIANKLKLTS